MSHTPGPWEAHDDDGTGTLPCILSGKVNAGGNFYVAQCNRFEDASYICTAVNAHAALVKSLQACLEWSESRDGSPEADEESLRTITKMARAALAHAKGKP